MHYDVFNGDADGIIALHQLRLDTPKADATLISGVKRDIKLLNTVKDVRDSSFTVLDISLHTNKDALLQLLRQGNQIAYIDHHFAGDIPENKGLTTRIDPSPSVCTSLIVDKLLNGRYRSWAVAAAFGDNLHDAAHNAAAALQLNSAQLSILQEIGELLNYNGYGATLEDLHFPPVKLFNTLKKYIDPFLFHAQSSTLSALREGFQTDMELALAQECMDKQSHNRVYVFPNGPWARRVAGVFANYRAREREDAAHALVVKNDDGTYRISVRAPLKTKKDADTLCLLFPTGGGRKAAAGINQLPADMLDSFLQKFHTTFSC